MYLKVILKNLQLCPNNLFYTKASLVELIQRSGLGLRDVAKRLTMKKQEAIGRIVLMFSLNFLKIIRDLNSYNSLVSLQSIKARIRKV